MYIHLEQHIKGDIFHCISTAVPLSKLILKHNIYI